MKKLEEFIARKVAGQAMLIPLRNTAMKFNGMILANDVSEFIWNNIENVADANEMVTLVQNEFEGDPEEIQKDVLEFMNELVKANWIE